MALDTPVDITNAACALIGEAPIQDFTSDLGGGQAASLLYGMVVDFNLGLQPSGFSFAREIRQLSKTAEQAFSGYEFVYAVPGPYTGLPVFLSDDPSDPNRRITAYLLTDGKVHSSHDPLYAMVKFRPDPYRWTATFRAATIHALAAALAWSISSDRNSFERLNEKAYGTAIENHRGGMMRAAIAEDGFANPPRPANFDDNPLTRAWRS